MHFHGLRIYDDNGDGSLDFEEFLSAMQVCGYSEEDNKQMFSEIDKDGSGCVGLEELISWYAQQEAPTALDKPDNLQVTDKHQV